MSNPYKTTPLRVVKNRLKEAEKRRKEGKKD
jgi:hypothetical protein